MSAGPRLAVYDEVCARLLIDPYAPPELVPLPRHRLGDGYDTPTVELDLRDVRRDNLPMGTQDGRR